MRKTALLIVFLFTCIQSKAQMNLLHNPSFETHWRCPQYIDMVRYANYWTGINDTVVSPSDTLNPYECFAQYCNTCSEYYKVTIPSSWFYTHYPRTGNGMMHMAMYFNETLSGYLCKRDYIQGRLNETLINGSDYCVTFYVALTGGSAYANDKIGAYLDDATIDTTSNGGLPQTMYTPQVVENAVITDTINWTKIQGTFTATGIERFITIGNFFDGSSTNSISTHFPHAATIGNSLVSLYLVDDVSVIKVGTVANAGNDTTIYEGDTAWIGEHANYIGDSVWHNDFDDYLPCKWFTATGALIDSNHSSLMVHPATTTKYVMQLDVCGTLTYDTITVTVLPVGIDGVKTLGAVKIYPNPATSEVHVSGLAGTTAYRLINAVGTTMQQGTLTDKQDTLDIARLSRGIYILELTGADGSRVVTRVLKQ